MLTLNKLAGAVALALTAVGAQASLVTGSANSDGELFFIAQDVNNRTLVVDLGIGYSTLQANSGSTDWFTARNLGSLVTAGSLPGQFTFGDGVKWNLASAKNKTGSGPSTASNNGLFATVNLTTSTAGATELQTGTTNAALNAANTRLNNIKNRTIDKANNLNTEAGLAGAFPTGAGADNDFYVFNEPTGPRSWNDGWNDSFGGGSGVIKSAATVGVDSSLAFFHWYLSSTPTNKIISEQLAGVWTLTQTGTLSYGAAAPVPLPPGAWLLGSGLIALLTKRRRAAAA